MEPKNYIHVIPIFKSQADELRVLMQHLRQNTKVISAVKFFEDKIVLTADEQCIVIWAE